MFWPQTLLPVDIPDARIFTYGYNANVVDGFLEGAGKNSISQHANDLMVELASELQDHVTSKIRNPDQNFESLRGY